jgi:ribosomal protein L37E
MQQLHTYMDTRVCAVCGFAGGRLRWTASEASANTKAKG